MSDEIYRDGTYLKNNPTWHKEDALWKARQIAGMVQRHGLAARKVCEIGCGSGEVLGQLQVALDGECEFWGYDISPQAIYLTQSRANDRLHFCLGDFPVAQETGFDLVLLIDVVEHVEDYAAFLGRVKPLGQYKILHIPLDLTLVNLLGVNHLVALRQRVGHLHYFTKETALHALQAADYHIVDWCYTPAFEPSVVHGKGRLAKALRKCSYRVSPGWTARVWGQVSLLVLAT